MSTFTMIMLTITEIAVQLIKADIILLSSLLPAALGIVLYIIFICFNGFKKYKIKSSKNKEELI